MTGPGSLNVYFDYGGFHPIQRIWDGSEPGTSLETKPNTHSHANRAFSEPGEYQVTFTADIVDSSGKTHSASSDLTFLVGDETDQEGFWPSAGLTILLVLGGLLVVLAIGLYCAQWSRRRRLRK